MSKYTVKAPNGRSVNIKCDIGRFEFVHEEVLTQGAPHDVAKLATIFPTIFVEKVEAAPVVAPVADPIADIKPLSHPSDADLKFKVVEGAPVETGTPAVESKSLDQMTDDEIAAEAARVAAEARGSLSDTGLTNSINSLRSEEKPDELDTEKVAAKLMQLGAAKTAEASKPGVLLNDEEAIETLTDSATEAIVKAAEVPAPVIVEAKPQPKKAEVKKTAVATVKGKAIKKK